MIFVPLPLFASIVLGYVFLRFVTSRDMGLLAHRFFAGLIAAYAAQSLLLTLRWGYGIDGAGMLIAVLAPLLPALVYLGYSALACESRELPKWPIALLMLTWAAFFGARDVFDAVILATYLGYGGLIFHRSKQGADALALSSVAESHRILKAMRLTSLALAASGLTDIYVVADFVQTGGQNVGHVIGIAQTSFILVIGLASSVGRSVSDELEVKESPDSTSDDVDIVARLEAMFVKEGLHKREDLSLRKLARRLGVPDRQVSNAINRLCGVNVSQFVNDFRIKEACNLLSDTEESILEISLAAGFASKSNFNREFARVTGKSPSEWRKSKMD